MKILDGITDNLFLWSWGLGYFGGLVIIKIWEIKKSKNRRD